MLQFVFLLTCLEIFQLYDSSTLSPFGIFDVPFSGCCENKYRFASNTATKSSTGTGGTCIDVGKNLRQPIGGCTFQYSFFANSVVRYSSTTSTCRAGTEDRSLCCALRLVVPFPRISTSSSYFDTALHTSCSKSFVAMTR